MVAGRHTLLIQCTARLIPGIALVEGLQHGKVRRAVPTRQVRMIRLHPQCRRPTGGLQLFALTARPISQQALIKMPILFCVGAKM